MEAKNDVFGDPCNGHKNYLTATWICEKEIAGIRCDIQVSTFLALLTGEILKSHRPSELQLFSFILTAVYRCPKYLTPDRDFQLKTVLREAILLGRGTEEQLQ